MATSLAAQLKKLAVPETQYLLSGDLRQASFLYDDKEAAKFEKQHFYNIGINGLQQLIDKDERFMEYEQNLFSPSSQSLQRYVQTSEVNKQLDITLTRFLLQLSPYMQLREAHKAMEWMVHRYNIHLRNVDALMMCVLPYHDQEPFIMALRLLKLNSNECTKWKWLEAVKKGGSFLPRQTLVAHCRTAKGFLGFMCDLLTKHIEANTDDSGVPSARHLHRVISFFTQTVLATLMTGPPTEGVIMTLMPAITVGLQSHDLADHMVSSYMILSQLLIQTSLAEKLLVSLVNVIAKNAQVSLLNSALTVLIIIYQKQNISKLPKKAFKYLIRMPSLCQILKQISIDTKAEPFITPFMTVLTKRALNASGGGSESSECNTDDNDSTPVPSLISMLVEMLTLIPMEKKTIAVISRLVVDWFAQHEAEISMEVDSCSLQSDKLFRIFRLLENRFSNILDTVIQELISTTPAIKGVVKKLYEKSVASAHQELITDPMSCLVMCLHHRSGALRKNAVEKLLGDLKLMDDKASVQSALAMRLQDEDPSVVAAVLNNPSKLWTLFDDRNLLFKTLLKKLDVSHKIGADSTRDQILKTLCCVPENINNEIEIIAVILSYLVALDVKELNLVKEVLASPVMLWQKMLAEIKLSWQPLFDLQDTNANNVLAVLFLKLIDIVSTFLMANITEAPSLLTTLFRCITISPRQGSAALLIIYLYESLIKRVKKADVKSTLQRQLAYVVSDFMERGLFHIQAETVATTRGEKELEIMGCLNLLAKKRKLPLMLISKLPNMLDLAAVPNTLKELTFWELTDAGTVEDNWLRTVTILTNLFFGLSANTSGIVNELAKTSFLRVFQVFKEIKYKIRYLCMLWMASNEQGISSLQKARVLLFSKVHISKLSSQDKAEIIAEPTPIMPSLLVLLSSPYEQVREIALSIMLSLKKEMDLKDCIFSWFCENLLHYKQEVTKDHSFLVEVAKNILEGEDAASEPPSKKPKLTSNVQLQQSHCLSYLLNLVNDQVTPLTITLGILAVLHRLDSVESFLPLMKLLKKLIDTHASESTLKGDQMEIVKMIIKRFTPNTAQSVMEKSESLEVLLLALKSSLRLKDSNETVQMVTLKQLSSKLMSALPYSSRQAVFKQVLNILSTTPNVDVGKLSRRVIKHMKLESSLIIDELNPVLVKPTAGTIREAKRNKMQTPEESELDTLPWKRIIILFELIQSKKKILDPILLVPVAFQTLGRVLELEQKGSGEYIKQLILGTINFICSHQQQAVDDNEVSIKGEHLNMELIVNCIRTSDNPHTHHQALLLLSSAAKIAPGLLLHNMMSVFTFMGANILRQDDAYSFHVIGKILENVIPALIMACEVKTKDKAHSKKKSVKDTSQKKSQEMMTVVLRVFVDAIPHIPSHRKIMLFEKLLAVMGVENYLWRIILLFIESVTVRTSKASNEERIVEDVDEKSSGPLTISDQEFLTSLVEKYSCSQLFQCFQKVLSYVLLLPEEKQDSQVLQLNKDTLNLEDMSAEDMEIFSIQYHTAKQLRHFKFATVFALNQFIGSNYLIAQMSEMDPKFFLVDYQHMMETLLQFISQVTQSHDKHKTMSTARFWRILLNKSHDLMENLVNLLPDSMFMEVVAGLMDHSLSLVQRRAMELLNNKLQHYKENLSQSQADMLLTMTSKLQSIVNQCLFKKGSNVVKDEYLVNGQTALYGLKVLCRILAEKNVKPFIEVLTLCVKVLNHHKENGMISASSMLCIAEVVSSVKFHTMEYLTGFMPLLISQLKAPLIMQHEVLLLATITSLQKIIEALPRFLSPYLMDIIVQVCIISSSAGSHSDTHKPPVVQKIKLICNTLATVTPTRTFLPVLEKTFTALENKLASCADCATAMLKDHIVKMSREDLITFSKDLLQFFFVCFDIRTKHTEINESDLDVIEGCVIEAFVSLVFKLSEAQFKPMLLQIYNWATDENVSHERVLVFYRLCDSLAAKLKNLFTLFAGHIIKHSAQMLDANNKSKNKCTYFGKGKAARKKVCLLLVFITDCLQKTLAHDTEGFLNKERFEIIMQPLVDQLENTIGKPSVCEDRVLNHVVPCLASLAAAAHDDSLWKDLNYQILLKTRHENSKVRIWALSAIDAFHKQLGEDYTQLVPETIPFMAELMEDESDEVEKHTQKVLAAMEISVGENLQEYF